MSDGGQTPRVTHTIVQTIVNDWTQDDIGRARALLQDLLVSPNGLTSLSAIIDFVRDDRTRVLQALQQWVNK